jgi:hypothetical protein
MGAPRADKPKIRYLRHAASLKACFCSEKAIIVKQAAEQVATIQPFYAEQNGDRKRPRRPVANRSLHFTIRQRQPTKAQCFVRAHGP